MSWIFHQIVIGRLSWLIGVVFFLVLTDVVIVYLTKTYKPTSRNKYFEFHRRHGIHKVNVLKLFFAFVFSWFMSRQPQHNPVVAVLSVTMYCAIVIKLIFDFLKKHTTNTSVKAK
jgi:hypothetical protein